MIGRVGAVPGNCSVTPLSLLTSFTSGNLAAFASKRSLISFGVKCAWTSMTVDFMGAFPFLLSQLLFNRGYTQMNADSSEKLLFSSAFICVYLRLQSF